MKAITHLEKVIAGETSAVTHLEKVIAQEATAVTYTEKVIAGTVPPVTHLQKVIAGVAKPVTHLEYVWAGGSPPSVQEYTGAVPVTFVADGTPLLDYLISGNTAQSGTPTPDNPIIPQGTGERTGNLLHEFYAASGEISGNSYTITKNSIETHNDGSVLGSWYVLAEFKRYGNYANYTPIDEKHSFKIPAGTYTFSANENIHSGDNGLCLIVGQLGQTVAGATRGAKNIGVGRTFTVDADSYVCPVLEIRYDSHVDEYILANPMLNTGSTALPYEPYGYKIPISSASTTTPVYLGEVETTRKIRKIDLGTLNWSQTKSGNFLANEAISDCRIISNLQTGNTICTHLSEASGNNVANTPYSFCSCLNQQARPFINKTGFENLTAEEFKETMSGVYMWYVLATPTTGIVNEPLMRIGDYADTLSYAQAGVPIPTANGSTTLDVETTVKPSEVYVKYRGEAVATVSELSAEVSSPEAIPAEENPEETEEEENGSENVSL